MQKLENEINLIGLHSRSIRFIWKKRFSAPHVCWFRFVCVRVCARCRRTALSVSCPGLVFVRIFQKNPVRCLSVSILFRARILSGYLEKRLSGVYLSDRTMTRKSCPVRRPLVCAFVRPYSGYLIIFSKKILDIHLA